MTFQNCDTFVTDFLKSNDLSSKITTFGSLGTMILMKTLVLDERCETFRKKY